MFLNDNNFDQFSKEKTRVQLLAGSSTFDWNRSDKFKNLIRHSLQRVSGTFYSGFRRRRRFGFRSNLNWIFIVNHRWLVLLLFKSSVSAHFHILFESVNSVFTFAWCWISLNIFQFWFRNLFHFLFELNVIVFPEFVDGRKLTDVETEDPVGRVLISYSRPTFAFVMTVWLRSAAFPGKKWTVFNFLFPTSA